MSEALPNLKNKTPSDIKSPEDPTKSNLSNTRLPKVGGGRGDRKSADLKAAKLEKERLKALELKNQPKDFFKLTVNEHVNFHNHENHLNNYYKRFLGLKLSKHQTFSQSMRPENNFGIKRDSEISAYVVSKEMVTSRNEFDKHM